MALSTPTEVRRRLLARRDVDPNDVEPETEHRGRAAEARTRLDFEAFYRSQYPSVVRLAYSLCGSMQIAEELAQEAFVSAHGRWRRLVGFDRPDLWVRRVVINRSISFRRREAIERRAVARIRPDADQTNEPVLNDEVVWQALRELSPRQAEVLALFYVEDQPLSAVAEILDLGPETVKTHLKRGRAALAERLAERGHVR
ncbi:MAG: sigma-70 family RNA polymerase sigma factor [Ilumatobacter sp.]|nr:sigma-70 family RNA polymerase sigma factor [Ilumatobacter sp.]